MLKKTLAISALTMGTIAYAAEPAPAPQPNEAQQILEEHYQTYKDQEYFSGAVMSYYVPGQDIQNYYVGTVSRDAASKKVSSNTLFPIGSITKSFTAAILLQLETEEEFSLDQPMAKWLPQYGKWSTATIEQLLNMTSGLPNYSDTPVMNAAISQRITRVWSNKELIEFVYPRADLVPPLKTGYFYTNTGYILASMVIEKLTNQNFKRELIERTIVPADLKNTFYPVPMADSAIQARLASGYNYNQYDNPVLVGKDVRTNNLTWAAAAGGVVSNAEDVIKWVKALFIEDKILDAAQKEKLIKMVSLSAGTPIQQTSTEEPRGFGLGVAGMYDKDMGNFWFYEGETLGYRALYIYKPCNGVIISTIFNSVTNHENDHAKEVVKRLYSMIIKQNPQLAC